MAIITETRRKTFIYKSAVFSKPVNGHTLASLLKAALKTHKFPLKRQHNPSGDGVGFSFINYHGMHGIEDAKSNLLGCEFFSYTKGADQSTLKVDPNATEIDVSSLPPKQNEEFLEGAVYFGVLDNHVVGMQSSALRVLDLEKHLNWFLAEHSQLIDTENYVALTDNVPANNKAAFSDAKGLVLSSPLNFEASGEGVSGEAVRSKSSKKSKEEQKETLKLKPAGRAWEALRAFLGEGFDLPDELTADDILNSRRLNVELFLSWQRTPKKDTSDFLADIAYKLRHVDKEIDYSVKTTNGTISKDEFKPTKAFGINWRNGRPVFDQLFPKMLEWLESLVKSGKLKL